MVACSPLPRKLFSLALICLLAGLNKNSTYFTKFGEKVAHGPVKKLFDFGGNLDHVTLGLWLQLVGGEQYPVLQHYL